MEYTDITALQDFEAKRNNGDSDRELLECLKRGMEYNIENYEIYVCLAEVYLQSNPDISYLCLEQALHFCDNDDDRPVIQNMIEELRSENMITVAPFSIVIPSYNCKTMMIECIESIRKTCIPETYEIIVVDNASTDGITYWLSEQNDIILIANDTNTGFGHASNQGVMAAKPENDIFFLNNDTIVPENATFWLRMGLYSEASTGVAGSVSNIIGHGQKIEKEFSSKEEWLEFAKINNIIQDSPYEIRPSVVGFALFVKRYVLDKVGLFDEIFGLGNFEDDDLCLRILRAGYKSIVCYNSFIFHYGSVSFKKDVAATNNLLYKNREIFKLKWGFNIWDHINPRYDLIEYITEPDNAKIKVLQIGCGMGVTLSRIKTLWQDSVIKGIEPDVKIQKLASKYFDIIQGDIESMNLPYEKGYFDYIICGDVIKNLKNPKNTLTKLLYYLAPSGALLADFPNLFHCSSFIPLLKGKYESTDWKGDDKTNWRFYTVENIAAMCYEIGLKIDKVDIWVPDVTAMDDERELTEGLVSLLGESFRTCLKVYQYMFKAVRR